MKRLWVTLLISWVAVACSGNGTTDDSPGTSTPLPAVGAATSPPVAATQAPQGPNGGPQPAAIEPQRLPGAPESPATALRTPDLQTYLSYLADPFYWTGTRATNIRRERVSIAGVSSQVVAANIVVKPGDWSGIIFTTPETLDWSTAQYVLGRVWWRSLEEVDRLALVLEDTTGKRWGWHPGVDQVSHDEDGWVELRVSRREADQTDPGFAWDRIENVHVSALASPSASSSENSVKAATILGLVTPEESADAAAASVATPLPEIVLEEAFPSLSYPLTLGLAYPDDGTDRLFLVLQAGQIIVFPNRRDVTSGTTFLDISEQVDDEPFEMGLLGLAFDPDYKSNGYFYIYYTASPPRRSVVSRFSVSRDDPNATDPNSERVILEVTQPHQNHNAGQLLFGPDGYLYIGLGDGGEGPPQFNGQKAYNLLGSILRIDVGTVTSVGGYTIPADNPFAGQGRREREEIWAYGLRNPWRFTFDRLTGEMWAGDVGERRFEEVNIIRPGLNYGWNIMEGFHCHNRESCDQHGLELPIVEYDHSVGTAVIGGYVYRGSRILDLYGAYVYGDRDGRIWGLMYDGTRVTQHRELLNSGIQITTFGEDRNGELYVLGTKSHDDPTSQVYRVVQR